MSAVTADRPASPVEAPAEAPGERARGAPVTILRVYALLLILIPPIYIFEPLGAVGTPATVVALCALLLWGVGVLARGSYLCRTVTPVRIVTGLLVGAVLLSYTAAHAHFLPDVELLGSDRAVLQVLSWAGVALLAAEGLRDRGELYAVLRVVVLAVAVMAFVGLLQFRAGIDLTDYVDRIPGLHLNAEHVAISDRAGFNRPAGTATHPIEFGSVIAMALPIALHLARFDLTRSRLRRWLPLIVIAVGVPVAVSRSAILASVIAAVVVFVGLEPRHRPRALATAAAFLMVTYVTTPGLLGALSGLFINFSSDSSITYRTDDYDTVEQYVQQSPLLGRGPGTYLPVNHIILDNQYLLTAIEIGLVGLVIVIGYLLTAAFLGRGARHASRDPAVRDLGQGLAAASLAGAVAAITFDGFSFMMYAGVIPLALGVAGAFRALVRNAVWDVDEDRTDGEPSDDVLEWLSSFAVVWPVTESRPGREAEVPVVGAAPQASAPAPEIPAPDEVTRVGGTAADTNNLRRVIVLGSAAVVLAALVALPFTLDGGNGGDGLDVAVGRVITPFTAPPATDSAAASSSTTTPPTTAGAVTQATIAPAPAATTPTTGSPGTGSPWVPTTGAPTASGPTATTSPGSTAPPPTTASPTPTTTTTTTTTRPPTTTTSTTTTPPTTSPPTTATTVP